MDSRRVVGTVVRGDCRGRALGFPTANLIPHEPGNLPEDGVYAGWLAQVMTGSRWPAAISVGVNPTFEGVLTRRLEAYALDRDDLELYGEAVEVTLVAHLRDMGKFETVDALVEQMHIDVAEVRRLLASNAPALAPQSMC